jgi:quercetin dioxygenase-like cupin family protein
MAQCVACGAPAKYKSRTRGTFYCSERCFEQPIVLSAQDPRIDHVQAAGKMPLWATPNMSAFVVHMRADEHLPAEVHPDATQWFMVLAGTGHVTLDGREQEITARDSFHVPPGMEHGIHAVTPMRLLTIYSPPEHAVIPKE